MKVNMSATVVLTKTDIAEKIASQLNGETNDVEEEPAREAELFEFDNCSKGLGIKICGGCSQDGEELYGVFIKRILPGGLADVEGGLQKGDQILEVNGDSLEGVTNERAVSILRLACASSHVEMVVTRDLIARKEFTEIMDRTNAGSIPCTPVPNDPKQQRVVPDIIQKLSVTSTENQNGASTTQTNTPTDTTAQYQQNHQTTPVINGGATPKQAWRGMIPSMASTPNHRESRESAGSTDDQYLNVEPSPVGNPLIANLTSITSADASVFDASNATRLPSSQHMTISRKFSLDPHVRLKVEKLNAALRYLGLEPTPEQEARMHSRLTVDPAGTVKYGDFVEIVKDMFHSELKEKNISQGAMLFAAGDITNIMEPPAFRPEMNGGASGISQHQLEGENEELRMENRRLQVLLKEKEEEMLRIRKEAQGAIQEQRTLRSKVHLAAEAQKAARDMEHDYEEVVHLLENEIARLKLQIGHQTEVDPIMQRRLAVLTCQLRKAESEKETYKVATEKLLQFTETVHESLSENVSGAKSRPLTGGKTNTGFLGKHKRSTPTTKALSNEAKEVMTGVRSMIDQQRKYGCIDFNNTGFLGKHKRSTPTTKALSNEAKEVMTGVRSMIDQQPLPFGWEETYTADGMKYYINHLNQITTWSHPLSNVTHLPVNTDTDKENQQTEPKQQTSQE